MIWVKSYDRLGFKLWSSPFNMSNLMQRTKLPTSGGWRLGNGLCIEWVVVEYMWLFFVGANAPRQYCWYFAETTLKRDRENQPTRQRHHNKARMTTIIDWLKSLIEATEFRLPPWEEDDHNSFYFSLPSISGNLFTFCVCQRCETFAALNVNHPSIHPLFVLDNFWVNHVWYCCVHDLHSLRGLNWRHCQRVHLYCISTW